MVIFKGNPSIIGVVKLASIVTEYLVTDKRMKMVLDHVILILDF